MGAKVYHFDWINDFAAAKNYAIDHATGDWIAFLDADEYFTEEDTKKLIKILRNIEDNPEYRKAKTGIICPWIQIDDQGNPFLSLTQIRVFRNTSEIRYKGSIHEALTLNQPLFNAPELSIMHTGYSKTAYADTGKATRNIELIKKELEKNPENAILKCYLADSLCISGPDQDLVLAEALYREALSSGQPILGQLKQGAYNGLIVKYFDDEDSKNDNFEMCRKAHEEFPENPDFCYYYGTKLHNNGDFKSAWEKLIACENLLKGSSIEMGSYIIKNPMSLFFQLVLTAEELDDVPEIIRCATLVLKEDKYQPKILAPYIQAFNRPGYETSSDDILALLSKIYDYNNTKDKIEVMRGARNAGNLEILGKILSYFTSEELGWLTADMEPGVTN